MFSRSEVRHIPLDTIRPCLRHDHSCEKIEFNYSDFTAAAEGPKRKSWWLDKKNNYIKGITLSCSGLIQAQKVWGIQSQGMYFPHKKWIFIIFMISWAHFMDISLITSWPKNINKLPPESWNEIGPILDDRLKEKILKLWKGALSNHFRMCLSVCLSVDGLQGTPFGLGT